MKLINKTQRIYLGLIVILLLVLSGIFLYAISWSIQENIDEALHSELKLRVEQYRQTDSLQPTSSIHFAVKRLPKISRSGVTYSDTLLYNSVEQENFRYRQIKKQIAVDGVFYQITLRRSLVESDDLFYTILITELIFMVLLIAVLVVLNRKVLQRLWNPFYQTLNQITHYRIGSSQPVNMGETKIDEFQRLNNVLEEMIAQVEKEYKSLKRFTENASHEIQTPLSVINSQIEVLLQQSDFTERQWKSLQDIYRSAGRLSRLNRALLLLTKIENRQFTEHKQVDISIVLNNFLDDYDELIKQKNITLTKTIEDKTIITGNPELVELLLRNVLSNALKHNMNGGRLDVCLLDDKLHAANTGPEPKTDVSHYFERFYKQDASSASLGLGLAIIKEICEASSFDYSYTFENDLHVIEIMF